MVFSSITFLYYFLPVLLLCYFIVPKKARNFILLVFSLLFYFYGEPKYILVLMGSIVINYFLALGINKYQKADKVLLVSAIIFNVLQLLIFKYTDFFIENINSIFSTKISYLKIIMPIGISFFTFQTLSYVIDVYKKKVKVCTNFLEFATYVSLFPQLVAGPIVRYKDIKKELQSRTYTFDNFASGVKRFVIGLAKKVIIANSLGVLCEALLSITSQTVVSYWLRAISYTLQIYFDFSGYSDMAIGLGLMLGFHFLENFNYPLISSSITDFWRRWHISLSSFFRDYIYIPLGGNRVNLLKWIRNILIVWFLTGFWHGASWNFIIWGLFFAFFLILEKKVYGKYLDKTKIFKYIYTAFLIIISFVIFNESNINNLSIMFKSMFGFNNLNFINQETTFYIFDYLVLIILSIIFATPLLKNIITKINKTKFKIVLDVLEPIFIIGLLLLSTAFIIDSSFNPFLYFRF